MILIVTPSGKGEQCAKSIQEMLGESSHVAPSTRKAIGFLRNNEYSAVLVDQLFLEAEPAESEIVLEHVGMAVPVYVNFAVNGLERVVRELRWALHRRKQELRLARAGPKRTSAMNWLTPLPRCCFPVNLRFERLISKWRL